MGCKSCYGTGPYKGIHTDKGGDSVHGDVQLYKCDGGFVIHGEPLS